MQRRLTGTSSKGGSHSGKKCVRANNWHLFYTNTQSEGEAVEGPKPAEGQPNWEISSSEGQKRRGKGEEEGLEKGEKDPTCRMTTRRRKTEKGAAAQELLSK